MNYQKIYNNIVNYRKQNPCDYDYTEKHHIVPRCLGGSDNSENLVILSAREHFICHLLLERIYREKPEHLKLLTAFFMMGVSGKHQERYITSHKYQKLREERSRLLSLEYTGDGNSQFGTTWISNPDVGHNMKIITDGTVPEGYFLGRNNKWKICTSCGDNHVLSGKLCSSCKKEFKKKFNNHSKDVDPDRYVKKEHIQKTCPVCNKNFMVPPGMESKKYCSQACSKTNGNAAVAKAIQDDLGNVFGTMTAAAAHHHVSVQTIGNRVKSGKYKCL